MSEGILLKEKKLYSNLFPNPTVEEYNVLKEDIKKNGQQVVIYHNEKGIILDGYTRLKILKELNMKPVVAERSFETETEEIDFIISLNMKRRHLTAGQRFFVYENYRQQLVKFNKEWNKSNGKKPSPLGISKEQVSKKAGIGTTTSERIIYVINNGTEDEVNSIKKGESVHSVYTNVKVKIRRLKTDKGYSKSKKESFDEAQKPGAKLEQCPTCKGRGKVWCM